MKNPMTRNLNTAKSLNWFVSSTACLLVLSGCVMETEDAFDLYIPSIEGGSGEILVDPDTGETYRLNSERMGAAGEGEGATDDILGTTVEATDLDATDVSALYGMQNLAAGKTATQSSTINGGVASRAVDGDTNGNWYANSVTHTNFDAQAWWQVDLGAVTDIGKVVLYNRTDGSSDRLSNFDILVSNNGTSWQLVATSTGAAPARSAFSLDASGRFIRVQLRGTNYLSLAEVQVFPPPNLAAGKTATQSSTLNGGNASRAVDGNTNGDWYANSVTHTGFDAQAWWQVDLGAVTDIGKVVLYNRTDGSVDRLSNFDILVSNNGTSWQPVATSTGAAPARSTFSLEASARFVRVQLRGTNYLSLAEVQVFPPQNLAAGKTATQSSTINGGVASRAVDDDTNGHWYANSVTHTDFDAQAWWQVDLGAVTDIGKVVLYNRTDGSSERLSNFDIFVSNSGTLWQAVATYTGAAPARSAFSLKASGRFVRVQLRGTNYLSLAEVQVFPPPNLAAGKTATQSSTLNGGVASRAVDGNTNGDWYANSVTHTGFDAQAWWQVDLGAVTDIGKVVLYNRTDGSVDRLSNFDVLVSNNGTSWSVIAAMTGAAPTRTAFSVNVSARFVRVQLRGSNYLSLAEVQVWR
jgi:hypothetical protein